MMKANYYCYMYLLLVTQSQITLSWERQRLMTFLWVRIGYVAPKSDLSCRKITVVQLYNLFHFFQCSSTVLLVLKGRDLITLSTVTVTKTKSFILCVSVRNIFVFFSKRYLHHRHVVCAFKPEMFGFFFFKQTNP